MDFLMQNPHNFLVHFPVASVFLALLFLLLDLRNPNYRNSLRFVLIFAALFSILSYFSGKFQAEKLRDNETLVELLQSHQKLGTLSISFLCLTALLSIMEKFTRKLKWITNIGLLFSLILTTLTGYYGGKIAHPQIEIPLQSLPQEEEFTPETPSPIEEEPESPPIFGD